MNEQLTKKERKALKREEKQQAREASGRSARLKKGVLWIVSILIVVGGIGSLIWYGATRSATLEDEIVARSGIHWHPELVIYVKGAKQEIPKNIGIGAVHQPIHTHDDLPLIHLEFTGLVRAKDIMLGQFFRNWNKDMRSFGANMRMIVNGKENTEYENYVMRDKDKIELHFD